MLSKLLDEEAYWKELADELGWRLISWSGMGRATFGTPADRHEGYVELSGTERNTIMQKIRRPA